MGISHSGRISRCPGHTLSGQQPRVRCQWPPDPTAWTRLLCPLQQRPLLPVLHGRAHSTLKPRNRDFERKCNLPVPKGPAPTPSFVPGRTAHLALTPGGCWESPSHAGDKPSPPGGQEGPSIQQWLWGACGSDGLAGGL